MNKQSLDLFRESCGMAGPLALRVDYPGVDEPLQWVLYQPFALIGREQRAHLQLDHDAIGRRHAYLQVVGGRIFFMDLEGGAVPSEEAAPRRTGWLDEEQVFQLGPYTLRQNSHGRNGSGADEAGQAQVPFPGRQAMPEVTLEFVNKTGRSSTWQMTPLLALVGGSPECRVHLVGDSVSNFHCSLVRTPAGVWVVDLFGKGGVRVNGQIVRQCRLDAGDQLQVGRFLIRVHYDTPPIDLYRPDSPAQKDAAPQVEETVQSSSASEKSSAALEAPEVVVTPTIVPPSVAPQGDAAPEASHTQVVPVATDQFPQGVDAAQHLLVPLAHQLSLMQKQMFDQFQQAMMMMFQMFNTLQKEQIATIRQELNHQQKLTQELTKLQAELNARQHAPATTASKTWVKPQPTQAPKSSPGAVPRPKISATSSMPGPDTPHPAGQADVGRPATEEEQSFHVWLSKRVHDIQEERETGWKKIVSFLSGK